MTESVRAQSREVHQSLVAGEAVQFSSLSVDDYEVDDEPPVELRETGPVGDDTQTQEPSSQTQSERGVDTDTGHVPMDVDPSVQCYVECDVDLGGQLLDEERSPLPRSSPVRSPSQTSSPLRSSSQQTSPGRQEEVRAETQPSGPLSPPMPSPPLAPPPAASPTPTFR